MVSAKAKAAKSPKADFSKWKNDFVAFSAILDIIPKQGGARQKLRPNAIQSAFEASRSANGRDIVLKPRQVGLTTWELARDVWFFLTRPGAKVVVVVQSSTEHDALKENGAKLRVMFESLAAQGFRLEFGTETASHWTLPDRDASLRIIEAGASDAAAQKKGRSGTISRLHITELAFFEYASATLNAMLECVPGPEFGSEVVIESTANGAAGIFFERYQGAKAGRSGYKSHFFSWLDQLEYSTPLEPGESAFPQNDREQQLANHGATPEQIKWYRAKVEDKKQDLVDQEYPIDEETCWLVPGRMFFDKARTLSLVTQAHAPIALEEQGQLRIYRRAVAGRVYVAGVDPSEGTGGDPGTVVVRDRSSGELMAVLHGQFPPWVLGWKSTKIARAYNWAWIVVERNNHGHAVLQAIEHGSVEEADPKQLPFKDKAYPRLYRTPDGKPGWYSTDTTRSAALDSLENAHRSGKWSTPDRATLGEMLTFVVTKLGKAEAATGAHDDLVMAEAILQDVISKPMPKTTRALPADFAP